MNELLTKFALDPEDAKLNFDLAYQYHTLGHTASAFSHYLRCAERTEDINLAYESLIRGHYCFDSQRNRSFTAKNLLKQALAICPRRPEAYFLIGSIHEKSGEWYDCYTLASIALDVCDFECTPLLTYVDYPGKYGILFQKALSAWWWDKVDEAKELFNFILNECDIREDYKKSIINNLEKIESGRL